MNLSGTYEHSLDDKKRIRIPKKLRAEFPEHERICFVKYADGCIAVFPESVYIERIEYMKGIRSTQPKDLAAKRILMRSVEWIEEDTQGRTVLSASMRKYAGIKKDVVTIGMIDYLEIWSAERLNGEECEEMSPADKALAEALLTVPM